MASSETIRSGLTVLFDTFPTRTPITDVTLEVWSTVFAGFSDDDFLFSVAVLVGQKDRKFFPTPGEVCAVLHRNDLGPERRDTEGLLRQIQGLGHYSPVYGWGNPTKDAVRVKFGEAVALAYGQVGPAALYSENQTTQDIARRQFAEELAVQMEREEMREYMQKKMLPADKKKRIKGGS